MNTELMDPYKILFVDDEAMALEHFAQTLDDEFEVLTAKSVDEAIAILDEQYENIGVLVTDQRMPGKQGLSLLEYAHENYPLIPRILVTAYADLRDIIAAVNKGEIFRYMAKPWSREQLKLDMKIAMNVFMLQREREELIAAKMSVNQQLVVLGRIKDLILISTALQVQLPRAQAAIRNFLTNACQILKATGKGFAVDVQQLDLGRNLVLETARSASLMMNFGQQYLRRSTTPAQADWCQKLSAHLPQSVGHVHANMCNALWACFQGLPALNPHNDTLEINGEPAHKLETLWMVLTGGADADLEPASQWLWFHLWAAESGFIVNLRKHTSSELCVSLRRIGSDEQSQNGASLEDLFDQFRSQSFLSGTQGFGL